MKIVDDWRRKFKRMFGLHAGLLCAVLAAADNWLPAVQGLIPAWAYVTLALAAAVLPGIMEAK